MKMYIALSCAGAAAILSQSAVAATVNVDATDNIYMADGSTEGTAPVTIKLGSATSITFTVTELTSPNVNNGGNSVTVNSGGNYNDPDGVGSASGENVSAASDFSGIKAPTAGFLAGVFTSTSVPSSPPTTLDFTGAGGTSFTSLSALLDQVFFIGDGLTGDGTGTTQTFYIPQSGLIPSRSLTLGLTDACGYNGAASCYTDNSGTYAVTYTLNGASAAVPEPASWALMISGFGLVGGALRTARRPARLTA